MGLGSPLAVHLHFRPVGGFRPASLLAVLDVSSEFGLHAEVLFCRSVSMLDAVGETPVFLLRLPVTWGPSAPQVLDGGDPFVGGDVAPTGINGGQSGQGRGHLMLDIITGFSRMVRGVRRHRAVLGGFVVVPCRCGLGATGWNEIAERTAHVLGLAHSPSRGFGQRAALTGVLAPLTGERRQRHRTDHNGQHDHSRHPEKSHGFSSCSGVLSQGFHWKWVVRTESSMGASA